MEAWADFLDLPELKDPRFKSRPGRIRYWQALGELVLSKQQSWKSHEFFNQAMDRRFVVGVIQSPTEVINCKSYSIGARSSSFPVVAARCTHRGSGGLRVRLHVGGEHCGAHSWASPRW